MSTPVAEKNLDYSRSWLRCRVTAFLIIREKSSPGCAPRFLEQVTPAYKISPIHRESPIHDDPPLNVLGKRGKKRPRVDIEQ
jgi:hypothetical protein